MVGTSGDYKCCREGGRGRDLGRVSVLSCWEDNLGALSEGGEGASQVGIGEIAAPPFCSVSRVAFN